jgi:hypothetical protein
MNIKGIAIKKSYLFLFFLTIFSFFIYEPVYTARASQTEKILDFKSRIQVFQEGKIEVIDIVKVVSAGQKIKHGIYRDFSTTYKDAHGKAYKVDFQILKVLRDGLPESYQIVPLPNGIRVYLGKKEVLLHPGVHIYAFAYKTKHKIRHLSGHDELFWNVTGKTWGFPIEHAELTVVLPPGAKVIRYMAYTGIQGERSRDYKVETDAEGNIVFVITRPLAPREEFPIGVVWKTENYED